MRLVLGLSIFLGVSVWAGGGPSCGYTLHEKLHDILGKSGFQCKTIDSKWDLEPNGPVHKMWNLSRCVLNDTAITFDSFYHSDGDDECWIEDLIAISAYPNTCESPKAVAVMSRALITTKGFECTTKQSTTVCHKWAPSDSSGKYGTHHFFKFTPQKKSDYCFFKTEYWEKYNN